MRRIKIGQSELEGSQLAMGCWRMDKLDLKVAREVVETALEVGIDFFDHADIYGGGQSEQTFGDVMKEMNLDRESILIQSKVGIRSDSFDFSKEHILTSVDGILQRLQTDYLDLLLLHRPDTLVEEDELADAFDILYQSGKVRNFGVSNMAPSEVELIKSFVDYPILVNQLQFGPAHTGMIDSMLNVNMKNNLALGDTSQILNYSRINKITIQPWSPFQVDLKQGLFIKHPDYQEMTQVIEELAEAYNVSLEAMVIAWISRHPAKMQTIAGSMNPERIRSMAAGTDIEITRPEWYRIYESAGRPRP